MQAAASYVCLGNDGATAANVLHLRQADSRQIGEQ